jgi:hypothetical protein
MSKALSLASGWRRSTRCESGHCVEVARRDGDVAMRNSTVPDLHLRLSLEAWDAFVAELRAGQFDRG